MKNTKFLLIVIILFQLSVESFSQYAPGAKQNGIANSDVALANDVFSIFTNPSALSNIKNREAGVYYSPAPFGLKELSNGAVAYSEPFSFGNLGVGITTYGFELYRENRILLAYSYNHSDEYFFGLAINLHTVSISKYGSDNAVYVNLGSLIYLTDQLRWGFSASNANRASWGNEKNQIPVVFQTGFSYDIIPEVSLNTAIEKELDQEITFKAGINYRLMEYISVRSGFNTFPSLYSGGLGIHYSIFQFDYAVHNHQELGFTHQFGLLISLEHF